MASDFGVEFDVDNDRGVATAADMLVERCADVEREVAKRNEAQTSLTKAKRLLEDRQHDLRSAYQKMERLHRSGGATDAEDFRKRAKIHSQWRDLERKRSEAIGHLQRLSGPGERLQALQSELRETDVEEIAEAIRRAEEERDAVDKEIGELNFDLGATRTDRENLASEEESSRLRAKQHRLLEKMREIMRGNWTVLGQSPKISSRKRRASSSWSDSQPSYATPKNSSETSPGRGITKYSLLSASQKYT